MAYLQMESERFKIEKNFEFNPFHDYSDLQLRPEIHKNIAAAGIKEPPLLHAHCLEALLSRQNILISSPPATGKSSLLAIALHQLLESSNPNLQFMILEAKEHLIKETAQNLLRFGSNSRIKYCICDMTTELREDYKPFKHCQVAILNRYKMMRLLQNAHRDYWSLKVVILDAILTEDAKVNEIMELLKAKAPQAVFWWFNSKCMEAEQQSRFIERHMPNALAAYVVVDHIDIAGFSHFYVQAQNPEEKLAYIEKIIELNPVYQKIIYCQKDATILEYQARLAKYKPGIVTDVLIPSEADAILKDFHKGVFNLLICAGKQFFARRTHSKVPTYTIIADLADVELYEILARRAGNRTNDRVYSFTENNDHISLIEDISEFYKIKISKWPSSNDE